MNYAQHIRSQQAPLAGLGLINSAWCDSFEQAVETLGTAVRAGDEAGLNSTVFQQAKTVHENETSYYLWQRTPVGLTNCSAQTARIATYIASINTELKAKGRAQVLVPPIVTEKFNAGALDALDAGKPPEEMSGTAKFAIIGGITVVGIIGIAYVTGQIAPLFRALKR